MESTGTTRIDRYVPEDVSPVVRDVLHHLCESEHPSFGSIVEWCETRGDCSQAVVCPHCGSQYLLDDDEMAQLLAVSRTTGDLLACGVRYD
jgi:hypothetical protein